MRVSLAHIQLLAVNAFHFKSNRRSIFRLPYNCCLRLFEIDGSYLFQVVFLMDGIRQSWPAEALLVYAAGWSVV